MDKPEFKKRHEIQKLVIEDLRQMLPCRTVPEIVYVGHQRSAEQVEDLLQGLLKLAIDYRLRIQEFEAARHARTTGAP